jgi:signal transduction histidine kinase
MIMTAALVITVGLTTALVATRLMHEGIDRSLDVSVADPLTINALVEGETQELAARFGIGDTFVLLADTSGTALRSSNGAVPPGLPDRSAIQAAASGIDRRQGTYGGQEVRLLTLPLSAGSKESEGEGEEDGPAGGDGRQLYLQAGVLLTGHIEQEHQLLIAIAVVGTIGTLGAAIVTALITRRALVPIRQAFETERRFVAVASHELRTPVAVIRASAEIIDREGLVGQEGRPFVADIIGETDRIGRLVGDMLELASADAGSVTLELRRVVLGPWFAHVGRRAGVVAESSGVGLALTHEQPAAEAVALADADRLDQCVLILVDNAVKHSPDGGVVTVGLALDRASRSAVLTVTDQGPGVPASERDRIFEPFARASGASRRGDGAGLGLAIARQLARRHGGDVTVGSTSSRGTTFRLTLPLAAAAAQDLS